MSMVKISFTSGYGIEQITRMEGILDDVLQALIHADAKHPPMDGIDEGYGTLFCEVAELKREIDRRRTSDADTRKENLHAACMTIKLLRDCYTETGEVIR